MSIKNDNIKNNCQQIKARVLASAVCPWLKLGEEKINILYSNWKLVTLAVRQSIDISIFVEASTHGRTACAQHNVRHIEYYAPVILLSQPQNDNIFCEICVTTKHSDKNEKKNRRNKLFVARSLILNSFHNTLASHTNISR